MKRRVSILKTLGAYALGMVAVGIIGGTVALFGWLFSLVHWDWFIAGWPELLVGSFLTLVAIAIGTPIVNHFFGGRRRRRRRSDDDDEAEEDEEE